MSKRSKYSLNGVYRCENFAQYVENDDFPRFPIGCATALRGWYIKFGVEEDDRKWVYPFISHRRHSKIQVRAYFNIIKKDGSSKCETEWKHVYLEPDEGCIGKYMNIERFLHEKKGYLDDGALTIEYGLQVDSEKDDDGIWVFNVYDKLFDWQTKDHMFKFTFRKRLAAFSHKQMIKLHSATIDANKNSVPLPKPFGFQDLYLCIQITHGVRHQWEAVDYRNVARLAFDFGFSTTVRYCERQLIEREPKLNIRLFKLAVKCNMRCYLAHLLKCIKTKAQLIDFLKNLHLEEMSSESMKAVVTKIFSF